MSKIKNNFIVLSLQMLAVLAIGTIIMPEDSLAATAYVNGYTYPAPATSYEAPVNNPKPFISSLSPSGSDRNQGFETIAIYGTGFVPGSVARVNGQDRPTTYIDNSNLLVEVNLNEYFTTEDGFFITVYNRAPGGGGSNAKFFTLENDDENKSAYVGGRFGSNRYDNRDDSLASRYNENGKSMASSVILGENTFLPSSLVQWILVAIIILVIIIIARKAFGAREEYDRTPLKHA